MLYFQIDTHSLIAVVAVLRAERFLWFLLILTSDRGQLWAQNMYLILTENTAQQFYLPLSKKEKCCYSAKKIDLFICCNVLCQRFYTALPTQYHCRMSVEDSDLQRSIRQVQHMVWFSIFFFFFLNTCMLPILKPN